MNQKQLNDFKKKLEASRKINNVLEKFICDFKIKELINQVLEKKNPYLKPKNKPFQKLKTFRKNNK